MPCGKTSNGLDVIFPEEFKSSDEVQDGHSVPPEYYYRRENTVFIVDRGGNMALFQPVVELTRLSAYETEVLELDSDPPMGFHYQKKRLRTGESTHYRLSSSMGVGRNGQSFFIGDSGRDAEGPLHKLEIGTIYLMDRHGRYLVKEAVA